MDPNEEKSVKAEQRLGTECLQAKECHQKLGRGLEQMPPQILQKELTLPTF